MHLLYKYVLQKAIQKMLFLYNLFILNFLTIFFDLRLYLQLFVKYEFNEKLKLEVCCNIFLLKTTLSCRLLFVFG